MPVKPVTRKTRKIPVSASAKSAWSDFSHPFKSSLNRMVDVTTHFGRFSQDVFSILLVLFALLSLLALLDLTGGFILSPWADFLRRWFGWGAPLLILATGFLGIIGFRRKKHLPGGFLGRVIVLEGFLFSLVAFLAAISGYDIDLAEQGKFGGLIGWGLADALRSVFGEFLGGAAWFALTAIFAVITSSLFQKKNGPQPEMGRSTRTGFKKVQIANSEQDDDTGERVYQAGPAPMVNSPTVRTIQQPVVQPSARRSENLPGGKKVDQIQLRNLGSMPVVSTSRRADVDKKSNLAPVKRDGNLPPLSILMDEQIIRMDESTINQSASILEKTLMDFGVPARVMGYRIGPTVTQFAVEPGYIEKPAPDGQVTKQKVRVNQISSLSRDLALAFSSTSIRIEAPVPGRSYVGIEIPNVRTVTVRLKPLLESERFIKVGAPLTLALGRDVSGQPVVADLGRMPHMLIAGTTGSGKSVCIAALAACLAMSNSPEDLRLVMVDPKMVELVRFNGPPTSVG